MTAMAQPPDHRRQQATAAQAAEPPILDLPRECIAHIFLHLPPSDIAALRLACSECAAVARLPWLWHELCVRVWRARSKGFDIDPTSVFMQRLRRYRQLVRLGPAVWSRWLRPATEDGHICYAGSDADTAFSRTVGVAVPSAPLPAWPFGERDAHTVQYFEVRVLSGGALSRIGVGWCTRSFPERGNQLGWEAGSYAYIGATGHAHHHSVVGAPFGPTFSTGAVIGSGLVSVCGVGAIFYTLNGKLLGTAFCSVRQPEALFPAVSLHSAGEACQFDFGVERSEEAYHLSKPPHCTFAFDLEAHVRLLHEHARRSAAKADEALSTAGAEHNHQHGDTAPD